MKLFSEFVDLLSKIEENPNFLSRITSKETKFLHLTWDGILNFYEQITADESRYVSAEELRKLSKKCLIVDEQLWQQLEICNNQLSDYVKTIISSVVQKNTLRLPFKVEENSRTEDKETAGKNSHLDVNSQKKKTIQLNAITEAVQDNNFFSEEDMKKFLDEAESTEKNEENDVDYFADIPSENEDSDDSGIKYDDFFGEEQVSKDESDNRSQTDNDEMHSNDEGSLDSVNSSKGGISEEMKSTFALKQQKLKDKISKLEEEALKEKPWGLKGEVDANQRPVNSLLEELVEVDFSRRPAPVITKEVTLKLEDIIIKRIKDNAYDDVEKKVKPVKDPHEFKKAIILDQEKSKLSLAEIYENEYLKQKNEQVVENEKNEKLTPEQEEISKMMNELFKKLDTLSNFHFTPKPAVPDIKIVSNLPAITMEEVAPVGASQSNLLAPEEISGTSKRQLIGKSERSSTDKKRERRKKKKFQAMKAKRSSKFSQEPDGMLKSKGVKNIKESNETPIKSSKTFFTKLQDELDKSTIVKKRKLNSVSSAKAPHLKKQCKS